jgi:hypothetical protein
MHYGDYRDGFRENHVVNNVWEALRWSFADAVDCERVLLRIVLNRLKPVADSSDELAAEPCSTLFIPADCFLEIATGRIANVERPHQLTRAVNLVEGSLPGRARIAV